MIMAHITAPTFATYSAPRRSFWVRFLEMRQIRAERLALANLSSSQLVDCGLTHDDVVAESQRTPWDIPAARLPNSFR